MEDRVVVMIGQCFQISWHLMNCNSLVSKCSNKDSEEMNVPQVWARVILPITFPISVGPLSSSSSGGLIGSGGGVNDGGSILWLQKLTRAAASLSSH